MEMSREGGRWGSLKVVKSYLGLAVREIEVEEGRERREAES